MSVGAATMGTSLQCLYPNKYDHGNNKIEENRAPKTTEQNKAAGPENGMNPAEVAVVQDHLPYKAADNVNPDSNRVIVGGLVNVYA